MDPNQLNQFFGSILQKTLTCNEKIGHFTSSKYNNDLNFSFELTNEVKVHEIIKNIKTNACGVDDITPQMLKYCSPVINKYIVHIINSCIEQQYFTNILENFHWAASS